MSRRVPRQTGGRSHDPAADMVHTMAGRTLTVGRMRLAVLGDPAVWITLDMDTLDTDAGPVDRDRVSASLTQAEARRLAGRLLAHAAAAERGTPEPTAAGSSSGIDVKPVAGESYAIAVRTHELLVDQPVEAGGDDTAATPTELLVASLASCVAYYAGRYLSRHDVCRDGLRVRAEYDLASDRPARVGAIRVQLTVPPGLPPERRAALLAVASHCTVHNTLDRAPQITVDLA
jgi:putative redox protein